MLRAGSGRLRARRGRRWRRSPSRGSRRPCSCEVIRAAASRRDEATRHGDIMETGRGEVERASRASLRGGTVPRAIRARRERGALEADRLVRAGKEVGIGLHAVQFRIEDGRDRHHHALLEELRRSRGHVRYYKMLSRRLRASAFAQRRARRGVRDEHATGRTHNQTARVRGCRGARGACWRVRT